MRLRALVAVALLALFSAPELGAQGPWVVTIKPTSNPVSIGTCSSVFLTVFDPARKGTPYSASGHFVSSTVDFDMSVAAPGGATVVGRYEGSNWSVCACQSATVGQQATISARYPATGMAAKNRVGSASIVATKPITVSASRSKYNAPGCDVAKAVIPPAVLPATSAKPAATPPASAPTTVVPLRSSPPPVSVAPPIPVAAPNAPIVMPVAPIVASPGATPPAPIGAELVLPAVNTATGAPAAGPVFSATAKMTSFTLVNGFKFVNDYQNNIFGPPLDVESEGLCGGMTYSVLDYFLSGKQITTQDYRPANGTTLQQYFYGRQFTSLALNLDRWIELWDPVGVRSLEFFNWGISSQLTALRSFIDRGAPVPLGLSGSGALHHDHQVLAIGYDIGRYKSDLGSYKEDVKIYIIDPNYPNRIMTLVPDPSNRWYNYTTATASRWRSYFVDSKYSAVIPPTVANVTYPNDSLIHELLIRFNTGADDMRGGADHVDVKVVLTNNTTQTYQNVSQSGRWLPHVSETARVVLTSPLDPAAIKSLIISTNPAPGISGDNWDMEHIMVYGVGAFGTRWLRSDQQGPYRFLNPGIPYYVDIRCCFWN